MNAAQPTMESPVTYIALSLGLRSVHLIRSDDGILILDSEGQSIARIVKGQKPRDALAKWICALPADRQLAALTAIRDAVKVMNPAFISDKSVFDLYPDTQIRI